MKRWLCTDKHVVGRAPMMRFNDLMKVARNRWMRAAHRSSFMKNRGGCLSLEVEVEMMLMIKTATLKHILVEGDFINIHVTDTKDTKIQINNLRITSSIVKIESTTVSTARSALGNAQPVITSHG